MKWCFITFATVEDVLKFVILYISHWFKRMAIVCVQSLPIHVTNCCVPSYSLLFFCQYATICVWLKTVNFDSMTFIESQEKTASMAFTSSSTRWAVEYYATYIYVMFTCMYIPTIVGLFQETFHVPIFKVQFLLGRCPRLKQWTIILDQLY